MPRLPVIVAAILTATAGCRTPSPEPTTPDQKVVPFAIDSNGMIRLPVTVGDTTTRSFIFDTGAGIDVLAPTLIAGAHGTPAGRLEAMRMTGERVNIPLYRVDRLRLGPLEWRNVVVGSADFLDQMGLPGIISLNGFRTQPVTLDFVHHELTVGPGRGRGTIVPIRSDDLRGESIDIFADFVLGGARGECSIDTGSQGHTLSTRYLAPLGIDSTSPAVRVRRSTTIAGAVQVRYITGISSVALAADTTLRQDTPRVTFSDIIYDCVIGLDWWKGRVVTFDIPGRRLVVSQAGDSVPVIAMDGVLNADHDDSPAFTPDGKTFYFDRTIDHNKRIMVSHWSAGHWTTPETASFSGRWLDQDPAVSPDGSYLVFSSNRPISGGDSIVFEQDGKQYRGAHLWRVDRRGDGWGTPVWLGPGVNGSNLVVAPSVAANGALYFIQRLGGAMHIYRSEYRNGAYLPAVRVALGDSAQPTHDPAIAPDESFLVFDYGKGDGTLGRLSIALREGDHWSAPRDLGDAVNRDAPWGAHLSPDHRTVYITGNTHIWSVSLAPWLERSSSQR